ncbi:MAG: DNA-directed RNA polymerase [Candidatus Methanofastidiosia archaeon]
MYKLITVRDVVRVPPNRFGEDRAEAILEILGERYAGIWDKDLGLVLMVTEVKKIGVGKIIPGDGASYHEVEYEILCYLPKLHEVVEGNIIEILEFGAFTRLGPVDGLVHVSQITNDFINYDAKNRVLTGKESKKILKEGDKIRARIVTISLKKEAAKIGLTLRQPGLGKFEWIEEEREKRGDVKPKKIKKKVKRKVSK